MCGNESGQKLSFQALPKMLSAQAIEIYAQLHPAISILFI
jgi:hypothetical protein